MSDIETQVPRAPSQFEDDLAAAGVYYFADAVTLDSVKEVILWILAANFNKKRKYDRLTLIITSGGGDLSAAFALVDVMRSSNIPIHTVGLGLIGSAALVMFISGKKGYRTITPNTSILSHQYSWGTAGKEHELIATVKEFDLTAKRMIAHYRKCTGLSEKIIKAKLLPPQDIWLSAEEAVEFNLADSIKDI